MPAEDVAPVLEVRGLSKSYGAIQAVDGVSFALRPGHVTALVGDNGAGKSTVLKMISGALRPDSGEILMDGHPVRLSDPVAARQLGIETVYQDLALLPNLNVTSNLFLGRETLRPGIGRAFRQLHRRRMANEARGLLRRLEIDVPSLETPIGKMSGGQRQSIAIARAIRFASRVLLMDEPTAALGVAQSASVLRLVESARKDGISVLIISHILPHVIKLADSILVLRHGRLVGELSREDASQEQLVRLIVGSV